jgi:hypothetical protein
MQKIKPIVSEKQRLDIFSCFTELEKKQGCRILGRSRRKNFGGAGRQVRKLKNATFQEKWS